MPLLACMQRSCTPSRVRGRDLGCILVACMAI